jgi:hypothetical protein
VKATRAEDGRAAPLELYGWAGKSTLETRPAGARGRTTIVNTERFVALLLALALAGPASADESQDSGQISGPKLRDLCTDRPTKSTGPCTVDPGHFQIESDLFNAVFDRTGGIDTNTYLFTNPTLKYGVTRSLDVEINLAPVVEVTTKDRSTGARTDATGVGDLYLRAKLNLLGDDGGAVAFALSPYVKIPTARSGLGNGAVETGLIAPISVNLPAKFALSLDPEVDLLKDQTGGGHHANVVNLIGLSHPAGPLTLAAEAWSDVNFDPAGTVTQYSADFGVSWIPAKQPNLQFDGGVNVGLNRVTPGVQAYVGVSHRF